MTRILHVLASPRAEGTPSLVLDWLATDVACWQGVIVLHSEPADLTDRLQQAADAYEQHELFSRGPRKFTAIFAAIRTAVGRYKPDVVISWPTGFANWVCSGARLGGCRHLLVHAGNPFNRNWRNDWMARYVMWPLDLMGAHVVCCSDYVRDLNASVPGVRKRLFRTVYNSVRAEAVATRACSARSAQVMRRPPTALMVANLGMQRDYRTLLEAVPHVLEAIPDFRLQIAGGGPLADELKAFTEASGIAPSVDFLGPRKDVPELLGLADIFVFSTIEEGLGIALLEALAARLPVVATDVPACREVLKDGQFGVLVPPRQPKMLAEAMVQTLNVSPDRQRLDEAAAYAAQFTPESMIEQYLEVAEWKSKSMRANPLKSTGDETAERE